MGVNYLIDTNVIIDYYGNKLPVSGTAFIENTSAPYISVITAIELLGWYRISNKEKVKLQKFVDDIEVIQIGKLIVQKTIEIRQTIKIKLPDAIIAATALTNGLDLITHNVSDYKKIKGLKVADPYNL